MPLSGDGKRFTRILRVADYECDIHNRMKLSAILRHMQEISSAHLDALDVPYSLLLEHRQVFLLSKVDLQIYRRPQSSEMVQMATTPKVPAGAQFIRHNEMQDAEGNLLLEAETAWMLVDTDQHQILRPAEFIGDLRYTEADASPIARRRLTAPPVQKVGERAIRFSELDVNDHLNNAVYADICMDFLPETELRTCETAAFYIHFRREARCGDVLQIERGEYEPGSYYLRAEKPEGCCFEAALRLEKR